MGCDIHIFTECKKEVNKETTWINCDNWKVNPYYTEGNEDGESEYNVNEIYKGRNYNLFSMMADVRNYADNIYIAEPKGIPCDISKPTKKEYNYWGENGHTHSWVTLAEIKKFIKEHPTTKYSGLVNQEDSDRIDNGEMPKSFCQGTNLPNYVYREWEHEHHYFDEIINALELIKKDTFWIFDEEEHPEYDDKVRIVFWFDN